LFIKPDHIASVYHLLSNDKSDDTPEFQRDEIFTHSIIGDDGEVHVFWHNYPDPLFLYIGGYGISIPHNSGINEEKSSDRIVIKGGDFHSMIQTLKAPGGEFSVTLLKPREGWTETHLFGGLGAFCSWQSSKGVLPHSPVIIYVNGAKNRDIEKLRDIKIEDIQGGIKIQFERKEYHINIIK
jgi:hypothetical protein